MRTVVLEYNVYKYNELSEKAKEKVKQWYLDRQDSFIFTEMVTDDLYGLFGENDLKIQYSLAYCQGDGFNIYGEINARKILECLENHNGGNQLKKFKNCLTEKRKKNNFTLCGRMSEN